ncbi:chromosome segregation protein SMC [Litchfieldia alkalitelluris]|uniref:chromosome segregation protein SMC n=1 Tax=Litchfieldia alkalitelluris TaxID=304268 RepID=UPI000998728A|nr:chromosome segregation protein SMC [Litchfieldia alkalitelluris]
MFLKRLDIVGFKSFAERITVDFVPGVTAVVGPNGSGKSNITDAIRWVLGEQSARTLRGVKMEDIIFAGSDSRKSLNIADVTLTLDNSDQFLPVDYHEVSITRRVFRSGESEFLINKQACRLKDIVDLFMDSGLGREAFSIISQGKVEEILSSKAEERRTIFEEAAGVLKYKTRKKKAEYKLAETQENLNRVNDILHELEDQIEPLQIQASIANDYLAKKEELENHEVAVTVYEIENLHQQWESLKLQIEEHNSQEISMATSINKKEARVEQVRDQMDRLDVMIQELQQVLLRTSEELEKLEGRKEVLKERKKNGTQNKAQLEQMISELEIKTKQTNELIQSEQERLHGLAKEVEGVKMQLTKQQALLSSYDQNIESKIENLKSEYVELLNKQASSKNEIGYIEQQVKQQEAKYKRMEEGNVKYIQEREDINQEKLHLQTKLSVIEAEMANQIKTFRETTVNLETLRDSYQRREATLNKAYQFLQQTKSRKEMLEEMQNDYSGFFQGVKEVLKAREERLEGIEGAVAELLTVPKQYETAVEIALGAATQHIVVRNETNAREAIQYLKQHSFGRATFLPLNVIKERFINETQLDAVRNHPSFIGAASTLINFDNKYHSVVSNLLGNVLITTDLKGANELAKKLQYRFRMVTLDGDVVNPGGSMTGGAVKKSTNSLLGRSRELEDITAKLEEMETKTNILEMQVREEKQYMLDEENRLTKLRESGEHLRLKEQDLKSQYREIELKERNVNEHLALYDHEKLMFNNDQIQSNNRKNELLKIVEKVSSKLAVINHEIELLTTKKNDEQLSKETLQSTITDLKVIVAEKSQLLQGQKEKVENLRGDYNETSEKLNQLVDDLRFLSSDLVTNTSGEQELEEAAKKKLADKTETITLISNQRQKRLELQNSLENIERELKEEKRLHKQMVDVLKDEEVKVNRLDVDLENRLTHLREEYFLSFEAAKDKYPLTIEIGEARKKVKLIKLAIEELGTVNLGAIEEYERVSERFKFLTDQKNDLEEAKDTLYKVIAEMDEEMKRKFHTTFMSIRSHFEGVFQALFGGGRADLRLTNPDDLLNTGVDIVAQPPGKKLQNLGLMSGGERALTAIALLFSILKVRPVPFCVLDEVEAALDEANVFRFAQYLKKFSHETQFIVITHRKGTMEEADVLYGVTMQESGVSKLVSVRLEESKQLV